MDGVQIAGTQPSPGNKPLALTRKVEKSLNTLACVHSRWRLLPVAATVFTDPDCGLLGAPATWLSTRSLDRHPDIWASSKVENPPRSSFMNHCKWLVTD